MKEAPTYVPGHQLLAGKSVLVTAAGAGIGFAAAKKHALWRDPGLSAVSGQAQIVAELAQR